MDVKGERENLQHPGKTTNTQIRFLVNTIQNSELKNLLSDVI